MSVSVCVCVCVSAGPVSASQVDAIELPPPRLPACLLLQTHTHTHTHTTGTREMGVGGINARSLPAHCHTCREEGTVCIHIHTHTALPTSLLPASVRPSVPLLPERPEGVCVCVCVCVRVCVCVCVATVGLFWVTSDLCSGALGTTGHYWTEVTEGETGSPSERGRVLRGGNKNSIMGAGTAASPRQNRSVSALTL